QAFAVQVAEIGVAFDARNIIARRVNGGAVALAIGVVAGCQRFRIVLVVPVRRTEYHAVKIMAFTRLIAYGKEIALAFTCRSPGVFAITTPIVEHERKAPFTAEPGIIRYGPFSITIVAG